MVFFTICQFSFCLSLLTLIPDYMNQITTSFSSYLTLHSLISLVALLYTVSSCSWDHRLIAQYIGWACSHIKNLVKTLPQQKLKSALHL